jgi:hypothetical protein
MTDFGGLLPQEVTPSMFWVHCKSLTSPYHHVKNRCDWFNSSRNDLHDRTKRRQQQQRDTKSFVLSTMY